jgi:hypothetical protein
MWASPMWIYQRRRPDQYSLGRGCMQPFAQVVLGPTCSDTDTGPELVASMAVKFVILESLKIATRSKTSDL